MGRFPFVVLLPLLCFAPKINAAEYQVGPGQTLTSIADVPWEALQPGDQVLIHWRSEPYREKWVICRRGTEEMPIVVRGVSGPQGQPPVISGDGATTPSPLNFTNEERGVIKVGSANTPSDLLPGYILLENLEVRSARPAYAFTNDQGSNQNYINNAAAIYIEKAEHLTIRNCILRDSGNGLFIGVYEGQTQNILVEGNHIYDNGIDGRHFEHNSYTSAIGITFQFNYYGPLRSGCEGNNLKDRSAGLVVRYNWIEAGNRQLDLVDGEDHPTVVNSPLYNSTFVYGNILVEPDGAGNSQIVHYGGDSGTLSDYRKGTLYFYNNTVVSTRGGNTTLFRLSTNDESADVRNNIFYTTQSGNYLALLDSSGVLDLSHNWMKPGYRDSHSGLDGTINDDGSNITGDDPGFVDLGAQDFALASGSGCIDQGMALHTAALPEHNVVMQYLKHQQSQPRALEAPLDLGAYETCVSGSCGTPDAGADDVGSGDGGAGVDAGPGADTGSAVDSGAAVQGGEGEPNKASDTGAGCSCEEAGRGLPEVLGGLVLLFLMWRRHRVCRQ